MNVIRWPKRDAKLRFLFPRFELSKKILKSLMASKFFKWNDKFLFYKTFVKYTYKSSICFFRNSCLFTGHARSVFRSFKLCRHQIKAVASLGIVRGLRKSSF